MQPERAILKLPLLLSAFLLIVSTLAIWPRWYYISTRTIICGSAIYAIWHCFRTRHRIWAILLAFFCYYLSYISLTSLARAHTISVELASWLPNAAFGLAGLAMIARMDAPGDRDIVGRSAGSHENLHWCGLGGQFRLSGLQAGILRSIQSSDSRRNAPDNKYHD